MTPEESEAVAILWAKEGGVGEPSDAERERLLDQVRERAATIEAHVLDTLNRRMREGRREPRRHQIVAFAMFAAIACVLSLVLWIVSSIAC